MSKSTSVHSAAHWRRRLAAMLAVLAVSLVTVSVADAAYELERSFEVQGVTDIDVTPAGDVLAFYAPVFREEGVRRYTSSGQLADSWSVEFSGSALALAEDPVSGNVLLSDFSPRLLTYTASGQLLGAGPVLSPTGEPAVITDIDVDTKGDRYFSYFVVEPEEINGVLRFNAAGQLLASWEVPPGVGEGQSNGIFDIASDGRGNVYVVEAETDRVQRFTDSGAFVNAWGQFGSEPGQLSNPASVTTDPGGDVWVADAADRVQRFRPDGRLVEAVMVPDDALIVGLGFDASGRLYAATGGRGDRGGGIYVYRDAGGPAGAKPKISSKSLRVKKGKIKVEVACPAGGGNCVGKLLIRVKKAKLATGSYRVPAGKSKSATAKLTKQGKKLLARKRTVKVTVELRPKGGGEKVSKKLKLKG